MAKILRVIIWGRRQKTNSATRRLARILISTGEKRMPPSGHLELLKVELKKTFEGVQYDRIELRKAGKFCIGSEGHWILEWKTPKPGIPVEDYPGWIHQGRTKRIRDLAWVKKNPYKAVSEFFQWLKFTVL